METWLRVPDKGAVVAVGASVNSYWDEDDILEKRLFDAIYDEGLVEYGQAWMRAKELLLQYYGATNMVRGYFEMYNVMGDPTVEVLGLDFGISSAVRPAAGLLGRTVPIHLAGQQRDRALLLGVDRRIVTRRPDAEPANR